MKRVNVISIVGLITFFKKTNKSPPSKEKIALHLFHPCPTYVAPWSLKTMSIMAVG